MIENDYRAIITGEFSEKLTMGLGSQTTEGMGIFDIPYQALNLDTNTVVMSDKPRVTVFRKDFPFEITELVTVFVRGKKYEVVELEDNKEGAVTLWLRNA